MTMPATLPGDDAVTVEFPDDLRRLEDAAVNAWPALEREPLSCGWTWGYSGGGSQRANSVVTPRFEGGADAGPEALDAAIDEVERRYAERGAAALFRIGSLSEPAGLDARLAERGYRLQDDGFVLFKPVPPPAHFGVRPELAGVEWTFQPSTQWVKIYQSVLDGPRREALPRILDQLPWPRVFFLYRKRGLSFATALAVNEDGMVGVECVATREEGRRRGAARALMQGIEEWARAQEAHTLYLHVRGSNAAARALYRSLGYQPVGRFHYRVKDAAPRVAHLVAGLTVPAVTLPATDGTLVDVSLLTGRTLLTVYPYTGQPGVADPPGWDVIASAHGSTPQLKALAAAHDRLTAAGLRVLAVSPQGTEWQQEAATRLALPFPLLSDAEYALQRALKLPVFQAGGVAYPVRLSLLLRDGQIERVFHPLPDPVTDAAAHPEEVLAYCAGTP